MCTVVQCNIAFFSLYFHCSVTNYRQKPFLSVFQFLSSISMMNHYIEDDKILHKQSTYNGAIQHGVVWRDGKLLAEETIFIIISIPQPDLSILKYGKHTLWGTAVADYFAGQQIIGGKKLFLIPFHSPAKPLQPFYWVNWILHKYIPVILRCGKSLVEETIVMIFSFRRPCKIPLRLT